MRFQLFDRILEYNKGRSITGIKNITLEADDFVSIGKYPFYPFSLYIEAFAQLGGWLTSASSGFASISVLAMVGEVEIYREPRIGDTLLLKIKLISFTEKDSAVSGEISTDNETIAKIHRIFYGIVPLKDDEIRRDQRKMFEFLSGDQELL